jgi:hypothetical protein
MQHTNPIGFREMKKRNAGIKRGIFDIHHKNRTKTDNRPDNLKIILRKKHGALPKRIDNYKADNHKVVKLEEIFLPKKKKFYCLTCPETGNFLIDDGEGNGIASANCHIASLILTFFAKYLPEILKAGMVYVVDSPLFSVHWKGKKVFGNSLEELEGKGVDTSKASPTRLKGLGESNPDQLKEYAMNPDTRTVTHVSYVKHDGKMIFRLMGSDSSVRKELLGVESL